MRFFIVYELTAAQRATAIGALQAWMAAGLVQHAIAARHAAGRPASPRMRRWKQGRLMGNLVLEC